MYILGSKGCKVQRVHPEHRHSQGLVPTLTRAYVRTHPPMSGAKHATRPRPKLEPEPGPGPSPGSVSSSGPSLGQARGQPVFMGSTPSLELELELEQQTGVLRKPRAWALLVYLLAVGGLFTERSLHEPGFMRHFTYWSLALSWVWAATWFGLIAAASSFGCAFWGHSSDTEPEPEAESESVSDSASASESASNSDSESDPAVLVQSQATETTTLTRHRPQTWEPKDPKGGACFFPEAVFLALSAMPVLGILTTVAVLITALPLFDNGMIEAQVEDVPLSVANVANITIHYLPLALMALLVVGIWAGPAAVIGTSVAALRPVVGHSAVTFLRIAIATVLAAGVPGAFAAMYAALFDFTVEYDANVSPGPVFAVGLVALVVLVGVHIISSGKAALHMQQTYLNTPMPTHVLTPRARRPAAAQPVNWATARN